MALLDQAQLANDYDFAQKISMAMYTAAVDIRNEAITPGYETYHQKRLQFALSVIQAPGTSAMQMAWAVAASSAINAQSTDNDIQYTVNSNWDNFAGVLAGETPPAAS
jgi:hypothetical protein